MDEVIVSSFPGTVILYRLEYTKGENKFQGTLDLFF